MYIYIYICSLSKYMFCISLSIYIYIYEHNQSHIYIYVYIYHYEYEDEYDIIGFGPIEAKTQASTDFQNLNNPEQRAAVVEFTRCVRQGNTICI